MKIAVTYENEEIFQHFGHCEAFKLYETEDGKVVSSQVVGTGGSGHEALAVFLKNLDVEVLICGGIGGGRQDCPGPGGNQTVSRSSRQCRSGCGCILKGQPGL